MEKNLSSLDLKRLPSKATQRVRTLLEGDFVGRNDNVLIFGNPGGRSHKGHSGMPRSGRN